MKPTLINDDGSESELPYKWEICGRCSGEGKSSAYLGAYTADRWAEQDDDFKDDYIGGKYDRPCEHCNGSGKRPVADRSRMSKEQWRAYRDQQRDIQESRSIERQERLMEGGWREEGWFD